MNSWHGIGRLTSDPEVRYTQGDNSTCIASFRLAIDRVYKNKDGEKEADFISCKAFGKSGEFVEKYFRKGMKVAVTGRIQTGSYTNRDGNKVFTTDIIVESQEFCESKNASSGNGQQTAPPPLPPSAQPPMNQAQQPQVMPPQYQAPPQQQYAQPQQYYQAPPQQQPQQQYYQPQPQAMPQQPQQPVFQQGDPEWMKVPEGSPSELPFD